MRAERDRRAGKGKERKMAKQVASENQEDTMR